MKNLGLEAGFYKQLEFNSKNWFACSSYHEIGDGFNKNNVAYYLDGYFDKITEMKVVANINNLKFATQTNEFFLQLSAELFRKSMYAEPTSEILCNLEIENDFKLVVLNKLILFSKTTWITGKGYTLSFSIGNI